MTLKDIGHIVPEGSSVERLATGYIFTEGPLWDRRNRHLLFCDEKGNKILKWSPLGEVNTFHEPSGEADALTFDEEGNLIICEYGNHQLSMIGRDGVKKTLVNSYEGERLNNPNDVVVRSDGTIYFTDSGHGVEKGDRELPGVYRYWPTDGRLQLLNEELDFPNGIAFSPDESRLYVADTMERKVHVFEVNEYGLRDRQILIEMPEDTGLPDGMKVDVEGNIYVSVYGEGGGIWVVSTGGERIGVIPIPEPPANVAWGDDDWRTLYITASTSLYRIRLNSKGIEVY